MLTRNLLCCLLLCVLFAGAGGITAADTPSQHPLDDILAVENQGAKVTTAPVIDDLSFVRRIYIDLIGRIPTQAEVDEFQAHPASSRREQLIDKLIAEGRFTDRWTIFFADILRLRTYADGGPAFLAFVHKSVEANLPYDEMCRQLISANGKANYTPEVGFILGDGADPMALAGVTSQTFLGVRISCAECHDHPFDVWKREDFYGLAAYFGKTRRIENQFTRTVYTTEVEQTTVLWPPETADKTVERKPMVPKFPFEMVPADENPEYLQRLTALREKQQQARAVAANSNEPNLDALLEEADAALEAASNQKPVDETGVLADNQKEVAQLKLGQKYRESELRRELATLITDPRNKQFSRNLVNRLWHELVGRAFVEPIDDFRDTNQATHPKTIDFLAEEFIASGYDFRALVKLVVTSEAYQRGHLAVADEAERQASEAAFASTPMRRMISEVLYDSIVVAGHLFDVKHENGRNLTTQWRHTQVIKQKTAGAPTENLAAKNKGPQMMKAPAGAPAETPAVANAYSVEDAIELDFNAVLAQKDDEPEVAEMEVMSKEQIEAEMMARQIGRPGVEYIDQYVKAVFDDNPKFATALRMETPAPPTHFLRVFGQSSRDQLGEFRDHAPTMRQALLIMNGRLTHEASRVGELEPVYPLISGKQPDLAGAVKLIYREVLTREATANEVQEGLEIVAAAESPLVGIADLRWVLLNCNEFRFIP